jgi:hypothetical protein
MTKLYAGIGGRTTPPEVCEEFTRIAYRLMQLGYTLRSGGANGADAAFEAGTGKYVPQEIWLPWEGFNNNDSLLILENPIPQSVIAIAEEIYDRWDSANEAVRKLHARNVYQILGHDLHTPVDFVVCWTDRPNTDTGGTQFGMHLAQQWGIMVYNFYKEDEKQLFLTVEKGIEDELF